MKRSTKIVGMGLVFFFISFLLTGGCVQPAKEDLIASGGLDREGHPMAFRVLPKTHRSRYVDWVAALKQDILHPRESLDPDVAPSPPLNLDIVFTTSHAYPIPDVVFPHAPHTLWRDCNNCHPALFAMKQGANPVSMDQIIKGEFCGRCHGTVAFPIVDCFRCHSRPKG